MQSRGSIMRNAGGILSTMGDTQYHGGYHDARGGYYEYCGVVSTVGDTILCNLSTVGDIMIHVWDIMSTVGCSVPWGIQITKHSSPTVHMISPMYIMIFSTVLSIPHGTQDIPHIYHDIPHGTEHPPQYSRYFPHAS